MKLFALIFLFAAADIRLGLAAGVRFPGSPFCISPDLCWRIRCETQEQSDGGALHTLMLVQLGGRKQVRIWASGRSCDALWSDDSKYIAITDWTGSNVAEILLVDVAEPAKAVPLDVRNIHTIAQKAELEGHCYYEALKWEGSHQLLIRVFGHTDETMSHGYAYYMWINTISGVAKLVKRFDAEGGR